MRMRTVTEMGLRTGQIPQGGAAPGGIPGRLEDAQRGETPTIVQLTTSGAAVVTETMIGIATATTGGGLTKTVIAEETAHPTQVEDVEIDTIDDILLFTVRQRSYIQQYTSNAQLPTRYRTAMYVVHSP